MARTEARRHQKRGRPSLTGDPARGMVADLGARLILATRIVDAAYRRFDRARALLVIGLAPDAVLDRFNDLAYGGDEAYAATTSAFRAYLFPWEEAAVDRHFPVPPARLLIGG